MSLERSPRRLPAKKRYGQHFLQAPWADKLVGAIDPQEEDRFLEIGPGRGALTLRLAPRVAHLTAVELDVEMVAALRPALPANVTLVHGDFLEFSFTDATLPPGLRVAGNLPYNVSSPILFKLLGVHRTRGGLIDATLMLQREVADRVTASPGSGDYGVLSIFTQLHCDVRRLMALPPGAFRPAPKVNSALVQLRFRPPAVALRDEAAFEAMVRAMFTQRRKTLVNSLASYAASRHADPGDALDAAGIDRRRRAETLQLTELARLADYFASGRRRAVL